MKEKILAALKTKFTGEKWSAGITDLELIEKTRDARFPKDKDLRKLLKICKTNDK